MVTIWLAEVVVVVLVATEGINKSGFQVSKNYINKKKKQSHKKVVYKCIMKNINSQFSPRTFQI